MSDLISRKRFLDTILGAGGLGAVFVVAYPLVQFLDAPARSGDAGEWVDAGLASEIPLAGSKTLMSSTGIPVILLKRGEDDFVAVEKKCPHLGCMVDLVGSEIHCPCHGARFTLEGALIDGPSPRSLKRFAVEIRPDGHIVVGKVIV